jgi:hypothetical protein
LDKNIANQGIYGKATFFNVFSGKFFKRPGDASPQLVENQRVYSLTGGQWLVIKVGTAVRE